MTKEQQEIIESIEGTAGIRVLRELISEELKKLDSVREINKNGYVAEQAIGRQLAYELLEKFLSEIKLINPVNKETRKTYE